jgi:hypothetical protein
VDSSPVFQKGKQAGFYTVGDRGPRHEYDMGSSLTFFSGFENLITLNGSGILRHLEAELSILRCLKLISGLFVISTLKKIFFLDTFF